MPTEKTQWPSPGPSPRPRRPPPRKVGLGPALSWGRPGGREGRGRCEPPSGTAHSRACWGPVSRRGARPGALPGDQDGVEVVVALLLALRRQTLLSTLGGLSLSAVLA